MWKQKKHYYHQKLKKEERTEEGKSNISSQLGDVETQTQNQEEEKINSQQNFEETITSNSINESSLNENQNSESSSVSEIDIILSQLNQRKQSFKNENRNPSSRYRKNRGGNYHQHESKDISVSHESSVPSRKSNSYRNKRNPKEKRQLQSDSIPQEVENLEKKGQTENEESISEFEKQKSNLIKASYIGSHNNNNLQHSLLAADIISRLQTDKYECMICTDIIKKHVAIWSCSNCYALFHLYCIKKWSKSTQEGDSRHSSWICPGCQYVYVSKPVPKCFCGKVADPVFNPYIIPHSCGEICGKKLAGEGCPHSCQLPCHPGHCPPCSANGPLRYCYCGGTSYRLRCGERDPGKSCGEVCGKTLNCGTHICSQVCHTGNCSPCDQKVKQKCYCGLVVEDRPCGTGKADHFSGETRYFSCNSVCGKKLTCGFHTCPDKCHAGLCSPCKLLPKYTKTCPCGKIPLQLLGNYRKSCTDPIEVCPNVCAKKLACGVHSCKENCHLGPCPPCEEKIKVPCRCNSTFFNVVCSSVNGTNFPPDPLLCKKICKVSRHCGRHNCGIICCPSSLQADPHGLDPSGSHICKLQCNKKLKCGNHKCDLTCHSGKCPPCHVTIHEPYICECGMTTLEPPILCGTKLPVCNHPCIRVRPCGHVDGHICHDRNSACPPCSVIVEKECVGGHGIKKKVLCHISEPSCGKVCGKALSCGQHFCKRFCHSGPCQEVTSPNQHCGQSCGIVRPLCGHSCEATCHPGKDCPKIPCTHIITIYCPCKRRKIDTECSRGGEEDHLPVGLTRELLCDELCERDKRSKQLADAFGKVLDQELYPDFLINLAKASPNFILKIEKQFDDLLKSGATKISFPPMQRLQRQIIHEMAKAYNLDSESQDREPARNVVITKKRESKLPLILLSQIIQDSSKTNSFSSLSSKPTILHISNFSSALNPEALASLLFPLMGKFRLKILDTNNALVILQDVPIQSALNIFKGTPFNVSEYGEQTSDNKTENKKVSVPNPYANPPKKLPQTSVPVISLKNSFDALPVKDHWDD